MTFVLRVERLLHRLPVVVRKVAIRQLDGDLVALPDIAHESDTTLYDIGIRLRRPDHRQGFVPHFLHQPVDDRGVESGEPHIAAAHNFIGNRRFQEADRTADTGVGRHDYTIDSKLLG